MTHGAPLQICRASRVPFLINRNTDISHVRVPPLLLANSTHRALHALPRDRPKFRDRCGTCGHGVLSRYTPILARLAALSEAFDRGLSCSGGHRGRLSTTFEPSTNPASARPRRRPEIRMASDSA